MIESVSRQRAAAARIRRMSDRALAKEARSRHAAWLSNQTEAYRELRTVLYRVHVNVLQERGLPVPE